ncbi:MAG: insulinase family protein, partial [Paramuribaculum sp.]|nr:insulinase family protein [Paramuribaculum sp.]
MGPSSLQAFHRAVARFSSLPRGEGMPKRTPPLPVTPFHTTIECDTHQAHTIIGAPTLSCKSPLALSLNLLTNMIGGPGMNSLLNIELREKRGLVYNVEASSALLTDTGVTSIYFGCAPEDTPQCLDIINRNLKRLAANLIGSARLDRARKQFAGQLLLTRLQPETEALSLPRRLMRHNCCLPLEQRLALLDTVTPSSLLEAASLLSPENLSTLTMSGTLA